MSSEIEEIERWFMLGDLFSEYGDLSGHPYLIIDHYVKWWETIARWFR